MIEISFVQFVKVFFTWDMIYIVYFTIFFCIFYPQNYFVSFVHLSTT